MSGSEDSVGMPVGDVITIAPYDSRWPAEYERVRSELNDALGDRVVAIHHVGSTSVPGLDAKPIIDILVTVRSLEESLALRPELEALGFVYRPDDDIPDRHYFPRTVGGLRRHHVSLAEPDSHHSRNTLAFRNALRADRLLAGRYAALKRGLAKAAGTDRLAYLNGKTAFIRGVLQSGG